MITTMAEENTPVEYPILKINKTGMIVLFTGPRVGTVVHMIHKKDEYVQPGSHSRFWNDDDFKECAKSVTLKNKREKKDSRFWNDDDFKECAKSVTLKNKREKKDAI